MATEKEQLLQRIRELEDQNSALQDKLDMIWAILAPEFDEPDGGERADDDADNDDEGPSNLVQISNPRKPS